MSDTRSVSSSTSGFLGRQVDNLNRAKSAATTSFTSILNQTEVAVGLRAKTGFTSGATYEAQTLSGQTKAFFNNAVNATKSALNIKP